jgi:hypothetical protein
MCAIVDANVRDQVFGNATSPAGEYFRKWLTTGKGKLVLGGRLRLELADNTNFDQWLHQAVQAGRVVNIRDIEVESATEDILKEQICKSDDPHVIALAIISGTRLLFTNDIALESDFKGIIRQGRVYTTKREISVTRAHRKLLGSRQQLCNC